MSSQGRSFNRFLEISPDIPLVNLSREQLRVPVPVSDAVQSSVAKTKANLLHANNGLLDLISYKNGKWLAVRSSPSLDVVPSQDA
ncbi:hypothetical protein L2E82_35370 [Cichorium intybus]|uniref:Uncharacterized protein n=1 Tax=Cichorium intybus TaxID=13427 RepID=A0ACB9BNV4_CICIN|nr:hypothetical protein L2E82_35370 [Cichorium intybus]